jgi:hypothetical protein
VGRSEEKSPLEMAGRKWVDKLRLILERAWDGIDWIDLAQKRDQWRSLVNTVTKLRVPQNAGKFVSS